MAYAAVVSLKHTLDHLSNSSDLCIVSCYEVITRCAEEVKYLENVLQCLDHTIKSRNRKKVDALDEQIREAVCRFEDVLESPISNQIVEQSEDRGSKIRFIIEMQHLEQDIQSFTTRMDEMGEEYLIEIRKLLMKDTLRFHLPFLKEKIWQLENEESKEEEGEDDDDDDDNDDDDASSRIEHGRKSKVVGLSNELSKMKVQLTSQNKWEAKVRVISVLGMAGIGKTTLANEVFEDPDISNYFYHRVRVRVGVKWDIKRISQDILSQVNPEIQIEGIDEEMPGYVKDEKIAHYLKKGLEGKSYLIVLDDVWDKQVVDLRDLLPFRRNGSALLITTRLQEVGDDLNRSIRVLRMCLLKEKESWDLLCEEVFGEKPCPPQLVSPGKKIAKNCEGLPLTIVTVARFLSKAPMDPEYWYEVAEKKNSVFTDAYDEMSKVLYPSYKYLPQLLKACFLYMGVFDEKYEIPRSNLINMWISEGFVEPQRAVKCLAELFCHSVVIIYQNSLMQSVMSGKEIKTCGLHSSFWHFCNAEARKNKFFHALNSIGDCAEDVIKRQRRLCFRNNVLFGIQQNVCDSTGDVRAPSARSLLCYGPYHQYHVPIWFGLRLIRVLDALNIRLYTFPIQALKLVQLTYFALTFNGDLPTSISKLRRLQYFIARRHQSIKSGNAPSYLPNEIWDMKELKHLQIMESDLQNPKCATDLLPNLQTLAGVSARSCTEEILGRMPNLSKLGVQVQLAPDAEEPLRWFDHIRLLRDLESLKCVIVNPQPMVVAPPPPVFVSPSSLKRLTLGGFGYPWEDMETIASFVNLEVLKLQSYAFQGPKWKVKAQRFFRLVTLVIEDTDLVLWQLQYESLPSLANLSLKHCYKLKEIHWEHDKYFRPKIVLEDCNPLAVACVKQLMEAAAGKANTVPDVEVHSSYMD
ncbi:hypothetical protein ACS0TY_007182 [Phlomoides rotata]